MPIYEPREDSWLLQQAVKKHATGHVLDIGTGSGIQAGTARENKRVKNVTAVDVQKDVIVSCKKTHNDKRITFIVSDLFSAVKDKRFDTLIFNPPYLPRDQWPIDKALIGGKHGYETLVRFLNEAGDHLTPNGRILIIFSNLTNKAIIDQTIDKNLLEAKGVAEQHVGNFETLYVYLLKKTTVRRQIDRHITQLQFFDEGWRGTIFTGSLKGRKVAIKTISKTSTAKTMPEAKWLKLANKHGIGPKLVKSGTGWLAYDFVDGEPIGKWLKHAKPVEIRRVLKDVLNQCFTLDQAGIAKEEMSNPYKHLLVQAPMVGRLRADTRVVMIDFERAHTSKRPKNVTQFCSYIINLNRSLKLGIEECDFIDTVRSYSEKPNTRTFGTILQYVLQI